MSIKQNGGVFGRNPTFNDVTIEGDLIINGEVFTGLDFQGSWNASTNTPSLASSTGTNGEFYIVSVAGTTNLNGITNWGIGDWAIFNGTVWQRVEGGADGNFDALTANSLTVNGTVLSDGLRFGTDTDHTIKWGSGAEILSIGSADQSVQIRLDPSDASNFGYLQVTDGSSDKALLNVDDSGDISFYDDSGNAKFFWDASAERLGLGTTVPALAGGDTGLHIHATNYPEIKLSNSTTGSGAGDGSAIQGNSNNLNIINREAGSLTLQTASAIGLEVDLGQNVSIPNGDLTIASGNGVYLGGTGAANKLEDYEEGTWTPVFKDSSGNSASTGTATGTYVKIGSVVHIQGTLIDINTSGLTGGDNALLAGFPFTINNSSATRAHGLLQSNSVTFTDGTLYLQGNNGQIQGGFKFNKTGAAAQQLVVNAFTSGSADVFFSMSYQTTT